MTRIPKKVADRLSKTLPAFQKVLRDAKDRDVNESDTVTIVTDMLAHLFGFDKYTEVTSEQAIRGTFCDLAVVLGGTVKYLIEVKAVGLTLKENHLRQALNYGANHGIPWVVLTNGDHWEIHRIKFEKPISNELTCEFDILEMGHRKADDLSRLFLLCKEGLAKDAIVEYHEYAQTVNRFIIGAIIQSDPVLKVIRRELRRLAPGARVEQDDICNLLPDILKRDAIEGEAAKAASRKVAKCGSKQKPKPKPKPVADLPPAVPTSQVGSG